MSGWAKWTILVATLGQRGDRFQRLMSALVPQLEPHGGAVTVIAYRNDGEQPLSHVRQALVERAESDYVSFLDDDDTLPYYFVDAVMACLDDDVDYVGWRMQCILNGVKLNPTFHSLEYSGWWNDTNGYYRDISHLNPIRRPIALLADFRRGDPPEDVSWADQIRATGKVQTQCYIDRVMYEYHATSDSTWRHGTVQPPPPGGYPMVEIDSPHVSYHPESTRSASDARWQRHVEAWSNPPVDDVGYLAAASLIQLPDGELRDLIGRMRTTRYTGYRNWRGLWRQIMGLDDTVGKDIIDYGCGTGMEALELARAGNRVALADISASNLALAERVMKLEGCAPLGVNEIVNPPQVDAPAEQFDVFYCSGVLHHSRIPHRVLAEAHRLLKPDGLARIMVYSDRGWTLATGTEPPEDHENHPMFERFVRHFDSVGDYADWYDVDRLMQRAGPLFSLVDHKYLTPNGVFLGAVLRKI